MVKVLRSSLSKVWLSLKFLWPERCTLPYPLVPFYLSLMDSGLLLSCSVSRHSWRTQLCYSFPGVRCSRTTRPPGRGYKGPGTPHHSMLLDAHILFLDFKALSLDKTLFASVSCKVTDHFSLMWISLSLSIPFRPWYWITAMCSTWAILEAHSEIAFSAEGRCLLGWRYEPQGALCGCSQRIVV